MMVVIGGASCGDGRSPIIPVQWAKMVSRCDVSWNLIRMIRPVSASQRRYRTMRQSTSGRWFMGRIRRFPHGWLSAITQRSNHTSCTVGKGCTSTTPYVRTYPRSDRLRRLVPPRSSCRVRRRGFRIGKSAAQHVILHRFALSSYSPEGVVPPTQLRPSRLRAP